MKDREHFSFYRSFYEAGRDMDDVKRLEFYDAILEKSFEKNTKRKKLSGVADIVFKAIIPVITNQNRNYLNGKKGVKAKLDNPPQNNSTTPLDEKLSSYKYKDKYKEKDKYKDKENNTIIESFESWWELYEKKGSKKKSLERWIKLRPSDRDTCFHVVHDYVKSTPEKQYRKNAESYLNQESWNDEIIFKSSKNAGYSDDDYKPGVK